MKRSAGRGCPGDEELLASFLGELDPAASERFRAHVPSCPLCGRKMKVLAEIAADLRARERGLPDELAPDEQAALRNLARAEIRKIRRDRRSGRLPEGVPIWRAAAAVFLMAAAAGIFFYFRGRPRDSDRGPAKTVRLVEPSGRLERAPSIFRWGTVANAETYGFEIFDAELRSVISHRIRSASVTLSPEEGKLLEPGQRYYWDVEALDEEGRPMASGRNSFEIVPPGAKSAPPSPSRKGPAI